MGEAQGWLFEPEFNRAVKVDTTDERITSDAGLLLVREADHRLGLTEHVAAQLFDPRSPDKIRYTLVELLRERLYAFAMGYAAQDDADRLAHDPAMKLAAWDRPGQTPLDERMASQPTQSRLVDTLTRHKQNRAALRDSLAQCCARHLRATGGDHAARRVTIDVDSFPIQVHGQQPGAAYNGYYRETVYHPLVASYSVAGDYDSFQHGQRLGNGFVHAILRQGTAHTAQGSLRFFAESLRLAKLLGRVLDWRIDAGIVEGPVLDWLTRTNQRFIGRIRKNAVLDALAEPHLTRPVGRPPKEGYQKIIELGAYQAESWAFPQRVVLVVIDEPGASGQWRLFPRYFFLVVGWSAEEMNAEESLEHYRRRGTFEDRLGEFREAIDPHLSYNDFEENETELRLALLAFNLASTLRLEYEDAAGSCFDLPRFQRDVLKAGAKVVKHARRVIVHVARVVQPFWRVLVDCLRRWKLPSRFPTPRGARVRTWMPPPGHAFLAEVRRL